MKHDHSVFRTEFIAIDAPSTRDGRFGLSNILKRPAPMPTKGRYLRRPRLMHASMYRTQDRLME
ncbi:MAG: hypothetical protein ACU0CO_08085 [Shimia sp.]